MWDGIIILKKICKITLKMISEEKKIEIISHFLSGKKVSQISKLMGISRGTIYPILKKFSLSQSITRKSGSGRKRSLDFREIKKHMCVIDKNSDMSSIDLQRKCKLLLEKMFHRVL
ncbi:hypothetical protein DMUE_0365 [Dictyocoela muelleri]|nr:hypothetical protein DMUE_0365 [Dictyocoela muelleri]